MEYGAIELTAEVPHGGVGHAVGRECHDGSDDGAGETIPLLSGSDGLVARVRSWRASD
jgi:hypothetical protein